MQEDETQTRGQFLLDKIKQFVRSRGKAPEDIYEIPLDKTDPIYGKPNDGWGYAYELSQQGRVLTLSSKGRDGKSQIKIGEVPF